MKDRIAKIMNSVQMAQGDFAKAIDSNASTLSNILTDKSRPTLDIVNKICKRFPNINPTWLLMGQGEMYLEGSEATQNATLFPPTEGADAPQDGSLLPNQQQTHYTPSQAPSSPATIMVKNVDKTPRKVTEIRVFYDDNTYESFVPKK